MLGRVSPAQLDASPEAEKVMSTIINTQLSTPVDPRSLRGFPLVLKGHCCTLPARHQLTAGRLENA